MSPAQASETSGKVENWNEVKGKYKLEENRKWSATYDKAAGKRDLNKYKDKDNWLRDYSDWLASLRTLHPIITASYAVKQKEKARGNTVACPRWLGELAPPAVSPVISLASPRIGHAPFISSGCMRLVNSGSNKSSTLFLAPFVLPSCLQPLTFPCPFSVRSCSFPLPSLLTLPYHEALTPSNTSLSLNPQREKGCGLTETLPWGRWCTQDRKWEAARVGLVGEMGVLKWYICKGRLWWRVEVGCGWGGVI